MEEVRRPVDTFVDQPRGDEGVRMGLGGEFVESALVLGARGADKGECHGTQRQLKEAMPEG